MAKWLYILDTKDISDAFDENDDLQAYVKGLHERIREWLKYAKMRPWMSEDEWEDIKRRLDLLADDLYIWVDDPNIDRDEIQYIRDNLNDWGNEPIYYQEQQVGTLCWINHMFDYSKEEFEKRNGFIPARMFPQEA